MGLYFLDYGAGNVQSLANTLKTLGYSFQWVTCPDDFHKATVRHTIAAKFLSADHTHAMHRA